MPSLRKKRIQEIRKEKKNYLRKTEKQRRHQDAENKKKASAHMKKIREALGFDKIREQLRKRKVGIDPFPDKTLPLDDEDPYWEFTPPTAPQISSGYTMTTTSTAIQSRTPIYIDGSKYKKRDERRGALLTYYKGRI